MRGCYSVFADWMSFQLNYNRRRRAQPKDLGRTIFWDLNVTCLYCPEPGQVIQRNYAHTYLSDQIKLVLHIDDDNTLEPDALSKLLEFWNFQSVCQNKKNLAGVSFNVIDLPRLELTLPIIFWTQNRGYVPGWICQPYCPASRNEETSWLLGGSTAWSREILDQCRIQLIFRLNGLSVRAYCILIRWAMIIVFW